jgi:hypothetical protein
MIETVGLLLEPLSPEMRYCISAFKILILLWDDFYSWIIKTFSIYAFEFHPSIIFKKMCSVQYRMGGSLAKTSFVYFAWW